jgi:hypothetical protein
MRDSYTGPAMTDGNLRALGITSIDVTYCGCFWLAGCIDIPALRWRLKCNASGNGRPSGGDGGAWHGIAADWTPASLAAHPQVVLQGAFILAKATGDRAIARESVDHLRRYIEMLFTAPAAGERKPV